MRGLRLAAGCSGNRRRNKYSIHLLSDIAIRALSSAVNDPTTAVQALDQIEDLLLRLGRRRLEIGGVATAQDVCGS